MTSRKAAKELLHIKRWLELVDDIVARGKDAYLGDDLLREAGDSLMMKLGEAANRLSNLDVLAPAGVEWALAWRTATSSFTSTTRSTVNSPGSHSRATSPLGRTPWVTCSRPRGRRSTRVGQSEGSETR